MVDTPISKLPLAGSLAGDEPIIISQRSTTVTITATTISAAASDNSYNDSANGFVTGGFAVGDYVNVSGFTGNAANNIFSAEITALTAGKMTIGGADGDVIVDDAAGESVTITKWVSKRMAIDDIVPSAGSWTPVVAFGGASVGVTYAVQVGRYLRIGNLVMATCHVQLTNNGTSPGNFTITGLPFASKNTANLFHAAACWSFAAPTGKVMGYIVDPNTTIIRGFDVNNNAAATEADVPDNFEAVITLTYECEP